MNISHYPKKTCSFIHSIFRLGTLKETSIFQASNAIRNNDLSYEVFIWRETGNEVPIGGGPVSDSSRFSGPFAKKKCRVNHNDDSNLFWGDFRTKGLAEEG